MKIDWLYNLTFDCKWVVMSEANLDVTELITF